MPEPGRPDGAGQAPRKSKSDLAREQLEPLAPGERPVAVTVAAIVALLAAISSVLPYLLGSDSVAGARLSSAVPLAILLLVAAVGMWRVQYWAVLGFQAYLVIVILLLSLLLLRAENWYSAGVAAGMMALAGALFWFLVRAMARIQMPDRKPPAQP